MPTSSPPFATQRLIHVGLLVGIATYAVIVAVVLQGQDGKGMAEPPVEGLDAATIAVGAAATIAALLVRSLLRGRAEAATGARRDALHFHSTLAAVAILEGGCLFALTMWMLNGRAVPPLVVACVLFALAIVVVPFTPPNEASWRQQV